MQFAMEDFLNIYFPSLLYNMNPKDYYVKGGRAHDAYFRETTLSPDWDVEGTPTFNKEIKKQLQNFAKKMKLELHENKVEVFEKPMYQYGFKNYLLFGKDPYFLDVIINEEIKKIENKTHLINNINYLNLNEFFQDLKITLGDRKSKLKDYIKFTGSDYGPKKDLQEFFEKFFEIKVPEYVYTWSVNRFILGTKDIEKYIKQNVKDKDVLQDIFNNFLTPLYLMATKNANIKQINNFYLNYDPPEITPENVKEIIDEFYSEGILSIFNLQKNYMEMEMIRGKYNRTLKRYKNILTMIWNDLTDNYKIYLVATCENKQKISLFNLNKNCHATLFCDTKEIKKYNAGC